ncbi:MAG: DEAD/DEAH box helicase [Gammaproteobacteria bacterium]|nr:DEAD/DEAH box helicase [Gammaproteobacteria bacterium]
MLIKAIAFKGPTDHLNQFFDDQTLVEGLQLLIHNNLKQWSHDPGTGHISAHVQSENKVLEAQGLWPLEKESLQCSCNEIKGSCSHLAALAIETKRRFDSISYLIKDILDEQHLWKTTCQWLSSQFYDPYPNMARHRIVYLLKEDEGQFYYVVYKSYLTQDGKYQLKEKLNLKTLNFSKLPKFFSMTDQFILATYGDAINNHDLSRAEQGELVLENLNTTQASEICNLILRSGRCFWKAPSRPPIKFTQQWMSIDDSQDNSKNEQRMDLPVLTNNTYFDVSHNRVITVRSETCIDIEQEIIPHIELRTQLVDCSKVGKLPIKINAACVYFENVNQNTDQQSTEPNYFRFDDIMHQSQISISQKAPLASRLRQLQAVPTITSRYELPVQHYFDIADRAIAGPFSSYAVWLAELAALGWKVHTHPSFELNNESEMNWTLNIEEDEFQQWFNISLGVKIDDHYVNLLPHIVKAIKSKTVQLNKIEKVQDLPIELENGKLINIPAERIRQILRTLNELFNAKPLNENDELELSRQQTIKLSSLVNENKNQPWKISEWLKKSLAKVTSQKTLNADKLDLNTVNANIRDYQKQGVAWLNFLANNNFGGVLADDMGLGKTLQTLSFLQLKIHAHKTNLIIVPTSLLANWKVEAKKFTPQLKTLIYYGTEREKLLEDFSNYNLILTSYGLVQRDIEKLRQFDFHTIILDEAQAIKNAKTRIAKSCSLLKSKHKFCLSGTPIENHLGELWSLFNFLMPGYLGTERQFNLLFREPIEKQGDTKVYDELLRKVKPFLLRRTKQQVATELPDKIEMTQSLSMADEQADFYEAYRLSMTEELQKVVQQSGVKANRLLVNNALLRLRQICCHPSLINNQSVESIRSAKLEWLLNVLPEMLEEGRKVLIFSSFRKMLDIIGQELTSLDIDFVKLTGQSVNRGELVDKFQSGSVPVFLISLKAGGSGLNLTAADTVIHFDPWWNPAAENQASDRAYRIGQDKNVFVYKLITRGTVEERIVKMQTTKADLADGLYQNSLNNIDTLLEQNWQDILSPITQEYDD